MKQNPEDSLMVKSVYKSMMKDKVFDKEVAKLTKHLKPKMVDDIKTWRVLLGASWRAVSEQFVKEYPEFAFKYGVLDGNQISGIQLCDAVMTILNETTEQGWN